VARYHKQELRDKEGLSAVDAELQAAEDAVPSFLRLTGRQLAPDTIRRLMQRAPGWRSRTRKNTRA
jgi:hypothetical protein